MKINLQIPNPDRVFTKPIQENLFDYSHFTEVWYGGASSGKSHGVVQKVILKALKQWDYPRKILFLRKVSGRVYESIYEDVIVRLEEWHLLPYCEINKTNREIKLPNGALLMFKGMDNAEKIKSIKGVSDVVMEEATEFLQEDYQQLTLRVRERKHKDKQIYLMFNPVAKTNWVYKYFFINHPEDTIVHKTTYLDNPFIDEQAKKVINSLKQSNPAWYRIYNLGEFATLDKLVFPNYTKRRLNKDSSQLRELPSMFGLDFGYMNDRSAFIHIKADMENKKLYFLEEYTQKHMLNDEIARAIKDMGYSKEVITADVAEQKSIEEMRRCGIERIRPCKKGKDSIMQGIQFMQQFDLVVDDRCTTLIEELENYTWVKDKKTSEYINKPVDSFNHVIDASRYALDEINGHGDVKTELIENLLF